MWKWVKHMLDDVANYLAAQGAGTVATDIFVGYMPNNPDSNITVIGTGGPQPDKELPFKKPTFQILIRNETFTAGKAKLDLVRSILQPYPRISQQTIGSTFFRYILAVSEGGHIGRDDNGLDLFSINFQAETR